MIVKDADALIAKPPRDARLFLLHGPDEAQAIEVARGLEAALGGERIEFDAKALAAAPGRLADEAAAVSMFGGAQVLSVRGAGENVAEAAALLLDAPGGGHPAVIVAGNLAKASGLRRLAEAHRHAVAIELYPPDARAFLLLAREMARARGLDPAPAATAMVAAAAAGERGVLARELDKFATYLDATPDRRVPLDLETVRLLGAGDGDSDSAPLVDAVAARDADAAARALARMEGDPPGGVPLLRAVARRIALIAEARAAIDGGASPDSAIGALRPPVFWKDKPAITSALGRWRADDLAAAASRLLTAERTLKGPRSVGERIADAALLQIASGMRRG